MHYVHYVPGLNDIRSTNSKHTRIYSRYDDITSKERKENYMYLGSLPVCGRKVFYGLSSEVAGTAWVDRQDKR